MPEPAFLHCQPPDCMAADQTALPPGIAGARFFPVFCFRCLPTQLFTGKFPV